MFGGENGTVVGLIGGRDGILSKGRRGGTVARCREKKDVVERRK